MPPRSFLFGGSGPPATRSAPGSGSSSIGASSRRSFTGRGTASGSTTARPAAKFYTQAEATNPVQAIKAKYGVPMATGKAKLGGPSLPRAPNWSEMPPEPPDGYDGDSINDALDDLLRQAKASLKQLDGIKARLPPPLKKQKDRRGNSSEFWQPRCRTDLWGDDDDEMTWSDLDSEMDSDADSNDASSAGMEEQDDGLWDFLRSACNAEPAGPANRANSRKAPGPTIRTSAKAPQPPPQQAPPKQAPPRPTRTYTESGPPPRDEDAKPPRDAPADRARANGFRFGSYGAGSAGADGYGRSAGSGSSATMPEKPETQVSSALVKAKAEGTEAVRSTLKGLLLKWHPDKAPQGDSQEDVAARAEATRVLRHVLAERARLSL